METTQLLEAFAVDLTRCFPALITLLGNAFREGRLRVAIMITTVGGGELPVDVDDHTGFVRSRTGFVARENARRRGGNGESAFFGETTHGRLDGAGLGSELRMDPAGLAIERVHQHANQRGGGDGQEVAARTAHERTASCCSGSKVDKNIIGCANDVPSRSVMSIGMTRVNRL